MRARRAAAALAALAVLGGCVTDPGYAPIDPAARRFYGYSDAPNGAGGHTIRVILPEGVEDPRSAFAHWDRRAAELCEGRAVRKQLHTARLNMLVMHGHTPTRASYEVVGDAFCEPAAGAVSASPPAARPPE